MGKARPFGPCQRTRSHRCASATDNEVSAVAVMTGMVGLTSVTDPEDKFIPFGQISVSDSG